MGEIRVLVGFMRDWFLFSGQADQSEPLLILEVSRPSVWFEVSRRVQHLVLFFKFHLCDRYLARAVAVRSFGAPL